MESPGAVGRRRGTSRSNVEDQALDQIAKEISSESSLPSLPDQARGRGGRPKKTFPAATQAKIDQVVQKWEDRNRPKLSQQLIREMSQEAGLHRNKERGFHKHLESTLYQMQRVKQAAEKVVVPPAQHETDEEEVNEEEIKDGKNNDGNANDGDQSEDDEAGDGYVDADDDYIDFEDIDNEIEKLEEEEEKSHDKSGEDEKSDEKSEENNEKQEDAQNEQNKRKETEEIEEIEHNEQEEVEQNGDTEATVCTNTSGDPSFVSCPDESDNKSTCSDNMSLYSNASSTSSLHIAEVFNLHCQTKASDMLPIDCENKLVIQKHDGEKGSSNDDRLISKNNEEMDKEPKDAIFSYFGASNKIAEARLAQRRQARVEAREIRMRELERQQKEQEQNADKVFDMQTTAGTTLDPVSRSRLAMSSQVIRNATMSSRRSSEDSQEDDGRNYRDIRHELKDVEERFRKAMIANAQLDNERASHTYQIQNLKDKLEEVEEAYGQLQREHKEKCRDHDALKRNNDKLKESLKLTEGQLEERDRLIAEQGLTIVIIENEDGTDAKRALVSVENAHLLDTVQGSIEERLKKLVEEKKVLKAEVEQLHQQLIDAKTQRKAGTSNGPVNDDDHEDAQREANKLIADFKYKLTKAEQEIATLQASLARSESQVIRYKSTADATEKAEAELKIERRKLQRENREMMEKLEELETSNNHLLKRLDKLKNAKSALLKDIDRS